MAHPATTTEDRKSRHLDICLHDDVRSHLEAGFGATRLRHEALPERALEDVRLGAGFLGTPLRAPLLISSMTGGTARALTINRRLAAAAQVHGIALALGSQRAALEDPSLLATYRVRDMAPTAIVFANLGAVQFNYGVSVDDARRIVDDIGADGLYLHLNPLQEALQTGGDTNFRGLLPTIESLASALRVPLLVKGVGSGLSVATARRLIDAGVSAIDVAGAGGTSWARVEGRRSGDPLRAGMAEAFAGWGYTTVESISAIRAALPQATLVASGGVRSGVDIAKAIALGADVAGVGLPFLEAADDSEEAAIATVGSFIEGLRIATFAAGCASTADLREALLP
jgi:isopentenyl-diphosphate delta-isomerase